MNTEIINFINIGIDTILIIGLGTSRMHFNSLKELKKRIKNTLSPEEIKSIIEEKLNSKLEVINLKLNELSRILEKITVIHINKDQ
jgi:hypothetical protein